MGTNLFAMDMDRQNSSNSSSSAAHPHVVPQLVQTQAKAVAKEIEKMLAKNDRDLMELNNKLGGNGSFSTGTTEQSAIYKALLAKHEKCVHAFQRVSTNLDDEAAQYEMNGVRESVLQLGKEIADALSNCFMQSGKMRGMSGRVVVNTNGSKGGVFLADELLADYGRGGGSSVTNALGGSQNMTLDLQLNAENSDGQTNILSRLLMRGNASVTEQSGSTRLVDMIKNLSGGNPNRQNLGH